MSTLTERKRILKECTKPIWEPCILHPVDCPNCQNQDGCQQREFMEAHPDKIKRCKFFWPKKRRRT